MRRRAGYYGAPKVEKISPAANDKGQNGARNRFNSSTQWARMRNDKLWSMKKALYSSYQAAVVQQFNPHEDLDKQTSPKVRALINHDKLKVAYQDKILSIPFEEGSVHQVENNPGVYIDNNDLPFYTNFHTGTVFKWLHGNVKEYVPDSYWIVYLQYSQETAYFRAEIRNADDEITIIPLNDDGTEGEPVTYRGWVTGPDETKIDWNVKKGVVWNDLNYTKELYITRNAETLAYFKRFDRVLINGKTWEVQAYNDNYGSKASNVDTGIIRVAIKETYTDTMEQLKRYETERAEAVEEITGPDILSPYDEVSYSVSEGAEGAWSVTTAGDKNIEDLISWSVSQNNTLNVTVLTTKAYRKGFDIKYGQYKSKHITIKSL